MGDEGPHQTTNQTEVIHTAEVFRCFNRRHPAAISVFPHTDSGHWKDVSDMQRPFHLESPWSPSPWPSRANSCRCWEPYQRQPKMAGQANISHVVWKWDFKKIANSPQMVRIYRDISGWRCDDDDQWIWRCSHYLQTNPWLLHPFPRRAWGWITQIAPPLPTPGSVGGCCCKKAWELWFENVWNTHAGDYNH